MVSPSTIGQNETFVGTGPYMLESWIPNDGARVVRNPNYWRADEGLPYLDAINFKFLVDQTVKRQAFDAGDIDGYISPGDEDIVDFLDDDNVDVWIGTAGANEYAIILNTQQPPFDDVRRRLPMSASPSRCKMVLRYWRPEAPTPRRSLAGTTPSANCWSASRGH